LEAPIRVMTENTPQIAVVVPCFRVRKHVLGVIRDIGPECQFVFVVDDCCPERTGEFVQANAADPRVHVIYNPVNLGVGGAVMAGYRAALEAGAEIVVKIDGDGQMDPKHIGRFVAPIIAGAADYCKGNRFYSISGVRAMPTARLFGNAVLSFLTKLSSGYWRIFDPTNGYTAIHATVLRLLELNNISERYFFESDMLINLGGVRAVVRDIPMDAVYRDEASNLVIRKVTGEFLINNVKEFFKRLVYWYFLRDFSLASLNLLIGILAIAWGALFGAVAWWDSVASGIPATAGSVMLASLPIIVGVQLLLSFLAHDIANDPIQPVQRSAVGQIREVAGTS
jgi:dolichol-phosphate mannosyltransferase